MVLAVADYQHFRELGGVLSLLLLGRLFLLHMSMARQCKSINFL